MTHAFRIWITAIAYQSILFAITLEMMKEEPALWIIMLPIEFLGGLPGLLLFAILFRQVYRSGSSPGSKWLCMILFATGSALITTILTAVCFGRSFPRMLFQDTALIYPAPLAALLALITYASSLNKLLHENTIKKIS